MRGICRNPAFSSHFSLWNSDRITVVQFSGRPFFCFPGSFSGLSSLEFRSISGGFRSLCRVFVQLVYIILAIVQLAFCSIFKHSSFSSVLNALNMDTTPCTLQLWSWCSTFTLDSWYRAIVPWLRYSGMVSVWLSQPEQVEADILLTSSSIGARTCLIQMEYI